MTTEKLFDEGKYMVIYLQPETVKMEERQFFLWTLEEMAKVKVSGVEGMSEDGREAVLPLDPGGNG